MKPRNKPSRGSADQVSELTTNRLSVYLRCLTALEAAGVRSISSNTLAARYRLNAAQIRKDLACFGEFGTRGVGYQVRELRAHLRQILGLDRGMRLVIMGAGNLGMALADYGGLHDDGFEVVALFDDDGGKIGHRSRSGVPIHDVRQLNAIVRQEQVRIAVLAVPAAAAQAVADAVVAAGVKAILSFSPGAIRVPADVKLKSVDVTVSLESLSFHLTRHDAEQ